MSGPLVALGVVHLGHDAMLAVSWNELGLRQSEDDVAVALARAAHGAEPGDISWIEPNEVVAVADARWPTSNRKPGRLQIGISGRLPTGMRGRLRRYPQLVE
jgi:hypothetical protein